MPPEMLFVRRALAAADDEQLLEFLRDNRPLLQPQLFQFLEALEQESREQGEAEVAERLALIRARAQEVAGPSEEPLHLETPSAASKPAAAPGEGQTPSGLIISRR